MYELLKNIATINNWVFQYSRRDFSNLYNEDVKEGVPHIFLDPVVITSTYGEYNAVESKTYDGSFMILFSSSLSEQDYDTRYQKYIKPLIGTTLDTINSSLRCDNNIDILAWRTVEVINVFDYNFDGIVVTYSISEDV